MGRLGVLRPQASALLDPESVLFVDDHESEVGELHAVFDERMGADQQVRFTRGDALQCSVAFAAFGRARQDADCYAGAL